MWSICASAVFGIQLLVRLQRVRGRVSLTVELSQGQLWPKRRSIYPHLPYPIDVAIAVKRIYFAAPRRCVNCDGDLMMFQKTEVA